MSIGTSDGRQFDSWFDYYAQEGKAEPVIDREDSQEMTNRGVKHMRQDIKDQSPAPRRPSSDPEKPTGELEIDRGHHVPLLAASTPTGIAIDSRASTDMEFEGKTHDITPFLAVHENAEREPYYAQKDKLGPKAAYEQAHKLVAIPAETSARNNYAIKNDLDPEEFGKAYNAHLQAQMKIAAEPSDMPRHPEAHTNDFDHYYTKIAEYAPEHQPIQMDVLGTQMSGTAHPGVGRFNRPANENKPLEERVKDIVDNRLERGVNATEKKLSPQDRKDLGEHLFNEHIRSENDPYNKAVAKQIVDKIPNFSKQAEKINRDLNLQLGKIYPNTMTRVEQSQSEGAKGEQSLNETPAERGKRLNKMLDDLRDYFKLKEPEE